jgi:hypothetical protein
MTREVGADENRRGRKPRNLLLRLQPQRFQVAPVKTARPTRAAMVAVVHFARWRAAALAGYVLANVGVPSAAPCRAVADGTASPVTSHARHRAYPT